MSIYSIDTDKLKVAGEEIKKISSEYNTLVNELYSKLSNMESDGVWVSDSDKGMASQFTNIVNKDKQAIVSIATDLDSLGSKIVDYSNSLNNCSGNKL